ncbi:cleavage/polyadenylation specificity factor [Pseudozyma hubeiensis SY62]|uniref:Cleavage/polyadenylation specificity factor n=1 Tax=Pseudozyma hubeiensis (strain SY62) TaxID=1305764 RepID=R9PIY0_PSEHS|nr:cleavage/polyadenylation specificity factor [Pseudozyma hubeiensis SY62]GAC98080.1 cleavage/polyadenylation specificity factor [Pseudozyma hubeiensis SY62]
MAAPANTDALGLLSAALNSSDKHDEARHLSELYNLLKVQPGNIPILLPSLISLLPKASTSLRTWIAQVMDLAFCRPALSQDTKATLAVHAPEAILLLIKDRDPRLAKIAAQCFASMYPVLFRLVCNDRAKSNLWQTVQAIKAQVVHLFDHGSQGAKLAVIKCYQRIVQAQSRGSTDPRAQLRNDVSLSSVPTSHPFLNAANLEEEANRLFAQIVTLIFTSDTTDLIMASVNSLAILAKARPQLGSVILRAMATWTPASLGSLSHTQIRNVEKTVRVFYLHVRRFQLAGPEAASIQKALETQQRRMEEAAKAYQAQKEAEAKRKREQIDEELENSKRVKLEPQQQNAPPASTSEHSDPAAGQAFRNASVRTTGGVDHNPLAAFDVKTLPISLVIDLIVANLQALSDQDLEAAIANMRANLPPDASTTAPPPQPPSAQAPLPPPPPPPGPAPGPPPGPPPMATGAVHTNGEPSLAYVKAEPTGEDGVAMDSAEDSVPDPLQMDIAEEDLEALEASGRERDARRGAEEAEDEEEEEEISQAVIENFALAPPEYLSLAESDSLIKETIARICDFGSTASSALAANPAVQSESGSQALWSSLVIRLATRGLAEPSSSGSESSPQADTKVVGGVEPTRTLSAQADIIRALMLEFTKADFTRRTRFAVTWMAEEWFCDRVHRKQAASAGVESKDQYPIWLEKLVRAWIPTIDAKDRSLAKFLADLPEIPPAVLDLVAALSKDKVRMVAGMSTLQDICISRPALRDQSAEKLLQLTRTSDRSTRARAIIAIKQCAIANATLEATILAFARSNLDVLIETPQPAEASAEEDKKNTEDTTDANGANGTIKADDEATPIDLAQTSEEDAEKPESTHPTDSEDVLRFVELPFSLCTKIPDMLDEIFLAYPRTPAFVQSAIETHIVQLIRALGPSHPRLLTLLRNFPDGADSLALCILKTLTEKTRTPAIVELVKELVDTRDVDPRFLVPIMADLDKAEIMKRLPRVVTILASRAPEDRALIKSVFQSIVQMPPQGFGSVSSNLPRVRSTELLTPVELMGLLHNSEREIGLKNTVAAIQICFSMTDVYRSEVLAAVLNQIAEEPTLPMLFMRTVIMAVSTYKSLSGYVARNLLSRLITKKIWLNAPLWDGFLLCAKQTAPSSFGALIQLPREQLREVVGRQPELRTGLVEYLTGKAGGNRARLASFMDMLGPEPEGAGAGSESKDGQVEGEVASA